MKTTPTIHSDGFFPSPHFLHGLCRIQRYSYLVYVHPFCAACFRQKLQVEVKWMTSQEQPGPGLFVISHVAELLQMPTAAEGNFCTLSEEIDDKECTALLQYCSL